MYLYVAVIIDEAKLHQLVVHKKNTGLDLVPRQVDVVHHTFLTMKHHVIYVPGIRDDLYKSQSFVVWWWRLLGMTGHCHEIPWAGQEDYEPKLQRLLALIDYYHAKGKTVSLVGASAGASAVLDAYVERRNDIQAVILICAKINRPESVGSSVYRHNPAFRTAMQRLQAVLPTFTDDDKAKFLSLYSPADGNIPHQDTIIPSVHEQSIRPLTHGYAIAYSLTFGAPLIRRFIKRLSFQTDNQ